MKRATPQAIPQAGYAVGPWCKSANIGRTTYYQLPSHLRPRFVRIGTRHIILEAPADYLARIAGTQQAQSAA